MNLRATFVYEMACQLYSRGTNLSFVFTSESKAMMTIRPDNSIRSKSGITPFTSRRSPCGPFSLESVFDVMSARQPAVERPAGQLLSCDDEYEFGVCECFDRNHLLVLDYQSLAGMHLHSADL